MSNSELLQKAKRKILSEIAMTKINPNINLNASASTGPRSPSGDSNPGADFIRWVEEQGIEINGIEIDYLADKLTGFVATQALKQGEILLRVPSKALINANTNVISDSRLRGGTIHGLIATSLALRHEDPKRYHKPWQAFWPPEIWFKGTMPICWSPEHQKLLPGLAKKYLREQKARLDADWEHSLARGLIPQGSYATFRYYWLIVNTRCFHWAFNRWPPKIRSKRRKLNTKIPIDDQMALCPVADYFNHSNIPSANFESRADECLVTALRDIEKGEEVMFRYGAHNNDYLLVEYGFILDESDADCIKLDDVMLPHLTKDMKDLLEKYNYLGDYTLDKDGICHRTACAIRVILHNGKEDKVQRFLTGEDNGESYQQKVEEWTRQLLQDCGMQANRMVSDVGLLDAGPQRDLLVLRYTQMMALCYKLLPPPPVQQDQEAEKSSENEAGLADYGDGGD